MGHIVERCAGFYYFYYNIKDVKSQTAKYTKKQPFPEMINFRERLFPQLVGWENKKIFIWHIQIE